MAKVTMVPVTGRNKGPPINGAHRHRYPLINGKAHGVVTHDATLMNKPVSGICGDCDAKHSDRSQNGEKCFHTIKGGLLHPVKRERSYPYSVLGPAHCLQPIGWSP
jgi:hypothetical protein